MDDPKLDIHQHCSALRGLSRINKLSQVHRHLWRRVRALAAARSHPVRVLDVAAGSGDLLVRIGRLAQRAGISLDLHACDISTTALSEAQIAAQSHGLSITTHQLDATLHALPAGFDLAHCGLFLHHLDPAQVELVLRQLGAAATSVLVQDLRRSRTGLALAHLVPRLLTSSSIVHTDAVRSVHGAYTIEEMADMARRAGLDDARVVPCFPQRLIVSWERKP